VPFVRRVGGHQEPEFGRQRQRRFELDTRPDVTVEKLLHVRIGDLEEGRQKGAAPRVRAVRCTVLGCPMNRIDEITPDLIVAWRIA
jgi:hypothetical protein